MSAYGRGAVVNYHGSLTHEHGIHIITAVDGNRLTLANRDYPNFTIRNVHVGHVTPTGEVAVLCPTCSHEWTWQVEYSPARPRHCGVVGCPCSQHGELEFPSLRDEVTA